MKINVRFSRKENNIVCDIAFERGEKDPPQINVESKTIIFTKQTQDAINTKMFGPHDGEKAKTWADAVVEDVRAQVLEWRVKLPEGFSVEI